MDKNHILAQHFLCICIDNKCGGPQRDNDSTSVCDDHLTLPHSSYPFQWTDDVILTSLTLESRIHKFANCGKFVPYVGGLNTNSIGYKATTTQNKIYFN